LNLSATIFSFTFSKPVERKFVMFTRLLALMSSMVGCSGAVDADPLPTISNSDEQNRVYRKGCDLIKPYMRIHGVEAKRIDAAAKAKIARGIALLGVVTKYSPSNWSAHWICGKGYQALGDSPAACDAFKRAFEIQTENPDVAREYMFECLNLGRGIEGLRAATLAVKLNPSDAGLHANLALAYLVSGDPPSALKAVDEALRLNPSDAISKNVGRVTQQIIDGKRSIPKKLSDLNR
jgi:tetratricopeptide (TPR) repeat protein